MIVRFLLLVVISSMLVACDPYLGEAPVRDANTFKVGNITYCRVQRGETLYSVAWRFDKDYRELARLNRLSPPYHIYTGQVLKLTKGSSSHKQASSGVYVAPVVKPVVIKTTATKRQYSRSRVERRSVFTSSKHIKKWCWPAKGKIIHYYSSYTKGIDIAGSYNRSVKAVAQGEVVYAGNGIKGYGNLVIIKHNNIYLSAYAYNRRLLVHAGDIVVAGQPIAKMGSKLHFEIRKSGQPLDPLHLVRP